MQDCYHRCHLYLTTLSSWLIWGDDVWLVAEKLVNEATVLWRSCWLWTVTSLVHVDECPCRHHQSPFRFQTTTTTHRYVLRHVVMCDGARNGGIVS